MPLRRHAQVPRTAATPALRTVGALQSAKAMRDGMAAVPAESAPQRHDW